jgi:hypothetical protein
MANVAGLEARGQLIPFYPSSRTALMLVASYVRVFGDGGDGKRAPGGTPKSIKDSILVKYL